jgi:L-threonylcarbamoyladenylate synthase
VLIEGRREALLEAIAQNVAVAGERGEYVGVMAPDNWIEEQTLAQGGLVIFDWGPWGDWPQLAQNLFAGLRYLDKPGVSVILSPLPAEEGLGTAIRDRLTKAAK